MEINKELNMELWDGKNGDLFTIEDWLKDVEDGYLIDYDGFGSFSDGKNVLKGFDNLVYPSDAKKPNFNPKKFTHIVWYNR